MAIAVHLAYTFAPRSGHLASLASAALKQNFYVLIPERDQP